MRFFPLVLVFLTVALANVAPASAQMFQRRHATAEESPPNALLVMLPTATRKIEGLIRIADSTRLASLRYDVAEIQRKMVADFSDNFSFCPVYFFYDTASSAVRSGQFAGHLWDANLKPVEHAGYNALGTDHLIAFFGRRSRDLFARQDRDGVEYLEMGEGEMESMIQQLVLLDAQGVQLMRPLPRTVSNRYPGVKTFEKRPRYYYRHYAKYFDMQYKPSASRASMVLQNFYKPKPKKNATSAEGQASASTSR